MIVLELIGLSGMTWLFPVAAYIWTRAISAKRNASEDAPSAVPLVAVRKFAVIIPAHNEESTIGGTLQSVKLASERLRSLHPEINVSVMVGADGCLDRTAEIARKSADLVLESEVARGKWTTLRNLVQLADDADWLVFADAGILWADDLLLRALIYAERPEVMGVAPIYRNPAAGKLESVYWNFEATLKKIENFSGGPVLVHGPTVMYRRQEVVEALRFLDSKGHAWINDDVAISMSLRLRNPKSVIVYAGDAEVCDSAESQLDPSTGKNIRQFGRRKRIIFGNLQCLESILIPHWKENPVAALISLRLAFRLFWALWGAIFALGLMMALGFYTLAEGLILPVVAAVLVVGWQALLGLFEAGLASFLVPYYIVTGQKISKWK